MHQRYIPLLDFALGELLAELAVGHVVLGDEDQSAGLFVEAMDYTRPQLAAHVRQLGEAMQ